MSVLVLNGLASFAGPASFVSDGIPKALQRVWWAAFYSGLRKVKH